MISSPLYSRTAALGRLREVPLQHLEKREAYARQLQSNGGPYEGVCSLAADGTYQITLDSPKNPFLQQHQTARILLSLAPIGLRRRIFEAEREIAFEIVDFSQQLCVRYPEYTDEFADLSAIGEWSREAAGRPNDEFRVHELAEMTRYYPKRFTLYLAGRSGLFERGAVVGSIAALRLIDQGFRDFDSRIGLEVAAMKTRALPARITNALFEEIMAINPNLVG